MDDRRIKVIAAAAGVFFVSLLSAAELTAEKIFPKDIKTFSEYALRIEPVKLAVDGLKRNYTFIWISDLHVIADDLSGILPASQKVMARRRDKRFNNPRSGKTPAALWNVIPQLVNNSSADAVIFGGDICDIGTEASLNMLKDGMKKLNKPFIFLREDHDFGSNHRLLAQKNSGIQEKISREIDGHPALPVIEYDDLLVVGWDQSRFAIKTEELAKFKQLCAKGKPVILLSHVPFLPEDKKNWQWITARRNAWGASKKLRGNMPEFVKMITVPGGPVKLVLCGHFHRTWDGEIFPGVRQHIFAPAFEGNIGIVELIPVKK